jgi:hypothetical protein
VKSNRAAPRATGIADGSGSSVASREASINALRCASEGAIGEPIASQAA